MNTLQLRSFIIAISLVAALSLLGLIGQYWLFTASDQNVPLAAAPTAANSTVTTTINAAPQPGNTGTAATAAAPATSDGKININQASETELTQLPGVGPATAAAIISFRKTHGNSKT